MLRIVSKALGSGASYFKQTDEENGILYDLRDGQSYEVRKFRNTWWLVQDMNFVTRNSVTSSERHIKIGSLYTTEDRVIKPLPPEQQRRVNALKYGQYYSRSEVQNVCPDGWRLPGNDNFKDLLIYFGFPWQNVDFSKLVYKTIKNGKNTEEKTRLLNQFKLGFAGEISANRGGIMSFYWRSYYWSNDIINIKKNKYFYVIISMSPSPFYVSMNKSEFKFWCIQGIGKQNDFYSVRCIKKNNSTGSTVSKNKAAQIATTSLGSPSITQNQSTKVAPPIQNQSHGDLSGNSGVFTDSRDGQKYKWVKIGNQIWMAENLNIGAVKRKKKDQTNNNQIEKYCSSVSESCNLYGGFYTWDEVMHYNKNKQGICPVGWRIPSDQDWINLEVELEGSIGSSPDIFLQFGSRGLNAGKNAKSRTMWINEVGTDSYGINILPSGCPTRNTKIGETAWFWTSTESANNQDAVMRRLSYKIDGIYRGNAVKEDLMNIRCLKN